MNSKFTANFWHTNKDVKKRKTDKSDGTRGRRTKRFCN